MSQVINSLSLHRSQMKGPPLHLGQLLHNRLLRNYLSNVLLLNPRSGMHNKAQEHIFCPLSFCFKHRLYSLSLGRDRVGLNCHPVDLEVCMCDTSPVGQYEKGWECLPDSENARATVGKLIRKARNPKFLISVTLSALISVNTHSQRHSASTGSPHKRGALTKIYRNVSHHGVFFLKKYLVFMFGTSY